MRQYLKWITFFSVCAAVAALVACSSSHSPKGVAQSFWDAVLIQDQAKALEFVTPQTQAEVDFSKNTRDWTGMSVKLGTTDLMGNNATVHTQIQDKNTGLKYSFLTYLVQENGVWRVDYARTRHASINSEVFAHLVHSLQQVNASLDKDYAGTMESFKEAAPDIKMALDSLADRMAQGPQTSPGTATTSAPSNSLAHKKFEDLKQALMGVLEDTESHQQAAATAPEAIPGSVPAQQPAH
ncbi:MAG TPA: hypothetical protein VI522_01495 [Gammaproteobacteria bacterium]|nr:hypothetical protein [Gammaproteobacteria bacterium]